MWRMYCPTQEGVAIHTTAQQLQATLPDAASLLPVSYVFETGLEGGVVRIASQKRPMFASEHEWRVVDVREIEKQTPDGELPRGIRLNWNPSEQVGGIHIHPDADSSLEEVVRDSVRVYAPSLTGLVRKSAMAEDPVMSFARPLMDTLASGQRLESNGDAADSAVRPHNSGERP